jgi:aminopeptidase YwaD
MKRTVLVLLALSLLAGKASAEERYLYQVFLKKPGDRALVKPSGFVPYALMESSIIAGGPRGAATAASLPYRTIAPDPVEGTFYLVIPPFGKRPEEVRTQVAERCEILAEDRNAFFVRAAPEAAEELPPKQFHIVRVWMTPIDLGLAAPYEPPRVAAYNPVIQWIINQITVGELSGMLRDLTGERATMVRGSSVTIRTRDSRTVGNSDAIWYFYERASSYAGMDSVKFDPFSWITRTDSNVVVTKVGRRFPRQQYLIGGHIDATSEQSQTYAPGADDNATSTLAALIAAKVTRQIPFKRTIKYVAFNCEEQGIYGSDHYASQARSRGDSLRGGLVPDMIGTNFTGNDSALAFHGNRSGTILLTDRFYQMDTTYHIGLRVRRTANPPGGSDYESFWNYNYEAGCFSEKDFSLVYHTTNDRISQMDTTYWTKYVKCLVATLCDLAEPDTTFSGIEAPEGSSARTRVLALGAHPNPARGATEIRYFLPKKETVTLDLYDLSGRRIHRLSEGTQAAGDHAFTWSGDEAPAAGVYFLRIRAGGESATRRVILLK